MLGPERIASLRSEPNLSAMPIGVGCNRDRLTHKSVYMKRSILLLVLSSFGCTTPDPDPACNRTEIRITPLLTRVSGTNFEPGDRIGLTISVGGDLYADNRELMYDGTTFSRPGFLWYNDATLSSELTAYYPYDPAGTPTRFTVPTDQSGSGIEAADLLAATRSDVQPDTGPVEMLFDHLLSKVLVRVDNWSDGAVTGIRLSGSYPTATVEIENKHVTVDMTGTPVSLIPHEADAGTSEAIVIPQRVGFELEIATADGKNHRYELEPTTLEGGRIYTIEVTVTNIDIACNLNGDIRDWTDGGTIGVRRDPETILSYAGVTYGVTTLPDGSVWMTDNLRCNPGPDSDLKDGGSGARYPGAELTDSESVERYGLLYDGDTAQGICPEGWRLPNGEDFSSLAAVWGDVAADFLPATPAFCLSTGVYKDSGNRSYLWSSSEDGAGFYGVLTVDHNTQPPILSLDRKAAALALPVRCVKRAD